MPLKTAAEPPKDTPVGHHRAKTPKPSQGIKFGVLILELLGWSKSMQTIGLSFDGLRRWFWCDYAPQFHGAFDQRVHFF